VLPLRARDIANKESGFRVANDPLTGTAHNEVEAPALQTHRDGRLTQPRVRNGLPVSCTVG
jgi:hypothetical protein